MALNVVMKQFDRDPPINATLQDRNGAVAFAGTEVVKFAMRLPGVTTPKVLAAAAWVSAPNGTVRYSWGATDTNTPGVYHGEFVVLLGTGNYQRFPNSEDITVTITEAASGVLP